MVDAVRTRGFPGPRTGHGAIVVAVAGNQRGMRSLVEENRLECKTKRPQSSLGYQTPAAFAETCARRPGGARTFGKSPTLPPAAEQRQLTQPELS